MVERVDIISINFFTSIMDNQENLTSEQLAEIEGKPLHEAAAMILGKEFPDTASAAKAMKDTFGYVGKAGEAIKVVEAVMQSKGFKTPKEAVDFITTSLQAPPKVEPVKEEKPVIDTSKFVSREEFDKKDFYANHPELKGSEKLVETYVKANPGISRDEILKMDDVKEVLGSLTVQKQKSILHSDSKIGVAQNKLEEAKTKMAEGKPVDIKEAESLATKAVMEAFDL